MRIDLVEVINEGPQVLEVNTPGAALLEILGVGLPGPQGPEGPAPVITKGLSFVEPGTTEEVSFFYTAEAITLARITALVTGSVDASVTFSLFFGPDRQTGTEIITGGTTLAEDPSGIVITDFDEPVIPALSWVWLAITNTTGVVNEFHVSVSH